MCAELLGIFEKYDDESNLGGIVWDMKMDGNDLLERARAALAQPEPQGPTDERITSIAKAVQECARAWSPNARLLGNVRADDIDDLCNAVLARWGRPAIEPQRPSDQELLRIYGVATPCYHVEEYKKELDFARAVWNLARR
jgi:hypothetical protein